MSQIVQQGAINTTALIVPDLYVQIVPPSLTLLNGVPTNILGAVGSASWGPVNAPTICSSMADYARSFGALVARKYDMGTAVAVAALQGANNFRCVRVTDGTDLAASVVAQTNCITYTAKYSGTLGNFVQVTIGAGSKASTFRVTVALPGRVGEVFDNITGSGNALWVNIAAAINQGQSGIRGPSNIIVASAGVGTTAPTLQTLTLAGGTDGAGVAGSNLIGADGTTRTGMYALRGTGSSIGMLADLDDPTTFTVQVAYGLSEGTYMIGTGPAGETITSAATAKATAGIDTYAMKVLLGDWCYWADPVNGSTRLVSPQGFAAGRLANLVPQQSGLNKPIYGIVATQRTLQNLTYATAELQALGLAGIDLITNPIPAGNQFGLRFGQNASSNATINGDNYTRMTNYESATIGAGMGGFVGGLQSIKPNDPWRRGVKATLDSFLQAQVDQGQIDQFQVICDLTNNSPSRIALGYGQADVTIRYLSVVSKLLVNVQGGQSVTISQVSVTPV